MELEKIRITDIVPAQYNPRKMSNEEYNKLSNSISEFGLVDPIIINLKNNHIIGGHQRYDVLLDEYVGDETKFSELNLIKLGDIGWVFPSTDLKVVDLRNEKALNLALNKISGEWNNEQLENLLVDLDIDGFDVTLTGFDNLDMKELDFNLKIDAKSPSEKLKTEIENEKEVTVKQDKEFKQKISNEETVYGGFEEEKKSDVKKYKCPQCGYEWD